MTRESETMTPNYDIVERLRTFGKGALLEKDAADEIERLRADLAKAEAALAESKAHWLEEAANLVIPVLQSAFWTEYTQYAKELEKQIRALSLPTEAAQTESPAQESLQISAPTRILVAEKSAQLDKPESVITAPAAGDPKEAPHGE